MKVAVRPLKGQQFEVEIEPELTVQDLKKKIAEANSEFPAELQKLIHSGKILTDATKMQDTGYKDGEFIVVMVTKAKAPAGGTSSTPAPAAQTPQAPTPAPAAATPAPASAPAAGGDAPTSYDTAASNLVTGGAMESTVQQLMDMGYPRPEVERCLQAAFNNPDRAVEYLISGIPEGILGPPAGAPPAAAPPPGAAPPAAAPGGGGGGGAAPFPAAVPGGGGGGNPASLAALQELRNNPRFVQLAQMVTANPQALAQMLPALQQQNPEVARAIAENPEAFMQMLAQAAGGGGQDPVGAMLGAGGAGGAQGGGPGPTVVRLTEEERAAVERLEALGFDRNMAIQAYLACDKNEEMAANFLFDSGGD
mmetsp:Transcript_9392/g.18899  ORF Transcript_9392/g.18899 Transcript_9392/m.18899 type:complete len:365 (-) Transcript_9392:165-1259(-)